MDNRDLWEHSMVRCHHTTIQHDCTLRYTVSPQVALDSPCLLFCFGAHAYMKLGVASALRASSTESCNEKPSMLEPHFRSTNTRRSWRLSSAHLKA